MKYVLCGSIPIPIVLTSTGVIPKSQSQRLTRLDLHPNTYTQLQKSVILGTCSIVRNCLTFRHHASYIYRTDVPLLPRVHFLYIKSTNIFNYFFRLSLAIFVYSSTKCRIFPNVTLLGS